MSIRGKKFMAVNVFCHFTEFMEKFGLGDNAEY